VHDHQLYVVGRDDRGELHPYRFSRIRSVDVLDETFDYPGRTEYDPEQVFRDSFGIFLDLPVHDVMLRLHKQWTTYAQSHRWHDSQKVEVAPDHVIVRMRVRVCPELEAWILGFGEEAEVLAPAVLRAKIAKRVTALAALYGDARRTATRPTLRKARDGRPDAARRATERT
jgi:proteasome accessory factor B